MTAPTLPPLPEPWTDTIHGWAWDAEAMLAYARAAQAPLLARIKELEAELNAFWLQERTMEERGAEYAAWKTQCTVAMLEAQKQAKKAEAERDEVAKLSHEYRNERDALRALLDSCVICDREPVGVFTYSPPDFSVGISSGIWEELADGYDGTPLYRAIPKEQS